MNQKDLIKHIKQEAERINYENKDEFDKLERQTKMLVRKIFGNESHYIEDIDNIRFNPPIVISGVKTDWQYYFDQGMKEFRNLLSVLEEDIEFSNNYDQGDISKDKIKKNIPSKSITEIKVLLASPSDVRELRELILNGLETKFRREGFEDRCGKRIIVEGWEKLASQHGYPQNIVNEKLLSQTDIVVAIFKHQLGQPTIDPDTNLEREVSGTAEELFYAIRNQDKDKQVLGMLYFYHEAPTVSLDAREFSNIQKAWERLKAFKKEIKNEILYKTYREKSDLLEMICHDLCQNIIEIFDDKN